MGSYLCCRPHKMTSEWGPRGGGGGKKRPPATFYPSHPRKECRKAMECCCLVDRFVYSVAMQESCSAQIIEAKKVFIPSSRASQSLLPGER